MSRVCARCQSHVMLRRDKVLVCPMKSAPVLLTLSDSKHVVLPVDDDSDLNVVAAFDRRGEYIYTGNAKGKVRGRAALLTAWFSVKQVNMKRLSVTDSGAQHRHTRSGGVFSSDHRNQQHHGHQIHRVCTEGQVRFRSVHVVPSSSFIEK